MKLILLKLYCYLLETTTLPLIFINVSRREIFRHKLLDPIESSSFTIAFQADLRDREYHFKKRFNDILIRESQFLNLKDLYYKSDHHYFNASFRAASSKVNDKSLNKSGFLLLEKEWKNTKFLTREETEEGSVVITGIIKLYGDCLPR